MDTFPAFNSYYEKLADGTVRCIDSEIPFEIPDNWQWCRLRDIGIPETGTTPSKLHPEYFGNYIPFIGPANILKGEIVKITQGLSEVGIKYGRVVPPLSVLQVCIGGSIGKCAVSNESITFNQQINSITPVFCNSYYIWYILQTDFFIQSLVEKSTGTATPIINRGNWEQLFIPLPPLKEQERIYQKVNEFHPLIIHFNQVQNILDNINSQLRKSIKKSILQEAIQGRLVPQIASEGTADQLLEEIEAEKKRLVKEGKLKKSALTASRIFRGDDNKYRQNIDGEDVIIDDRLPFEIPDTWRWATLGELILDSTGLSYKKESLVDKCEPMVRVLRGGNIEEGQMLFKADDVMISAKYVPDNLYLKQGTFISPAVSSLEKIGKTALIELDYDNVVVGGFVLLLSPLYSDDNLGKYLYYFFQTGYYHNYCRTITKKSGQAFYNLSRPKLKECYVPIPSKEEIPRILSRIDQALASIMSR